MATTRAEAMELGLDRYHTGEECRYGHDSPRYTSSAGCVECTAVRDSKRNRSVKSTKPRVRVPADDWAYMEEIKAATRETWDE